MGKNYMPEVAKVLGVEIGEKFNIVGNDGDSIEFSPYKITEEKFVNNMGVKCPSTFTALLCGNYTLQKRPWRPKDGDVFFYVLTNGEIQKYVFEIDNIHTLMLFGFGNCFPTEEAAEVAVPEMLAKFEEIRKGVRE